METEDSVAAALRVTLEVGVRLEALCVRPPPRPASTGESARATPPTSPATVPGDTPGHTVTSVSTSSTLSA